MAVTIQQIAEKAGVSRGTVDRALNHRGRINPEVAEQIQKIADEMGYVHKERKKPRSRIKIGIVTQLAGAPFMFEINRGIQQAKTELVERGIDVILKEVVSVNEDEQLRAIDTLAEEDIKGLAVMPVESESIRVKLNFLIEEKHIPVVTFNSDIIGTKRSCFVGMDNRRSGRTAAGLMGMLTGGIGKILVITGFFSNSVNNSRVDGFIEELKESYPELELAGVHGSFDDDKEVEKIIVNAITDMPSINGVFAISGGQEGIARAYEKLHLDKRPYTIIYDLTPDNRKALEDGTVDFLIDQDGYVQGYESPFILSDIVLKKNLAEPCCRYTDINIKTKYNL